MDLWVNALPMVRVATRTRVNLIGGGAIYGKYRAFFAASLNGQGGACEGGIAGSGMSRRQQAARAGGEPNCAYEAWRASKPGRGLGP
ncbi:hypothetical protein NXC24_PC01260 (plasmid) [Rhizobium sp. NXC24]|nr:hypothetical protein NXC24_PC01260 [Rhizobium sp. NXC24]